MNNHVESSTYSVLSPLSAFAVLAVLAVPHCEAFIAKIGAVQIFPGKTLLLGAPKSVQRYHRHTDDS